MHFITRITFLAVLSIVSAFAQLNSIVYTTTSAAITSTQSCFAVASATGISAPTTTAPGTTLYIVDTGQTNGEKMVVNSISSTTVCVDRTRGGGAYAHASGAQVLAGSANWFYSVDPKGSCTLASTYSAPYYNTVTGQEWVCSAITGTWVRNGDYVLFVPSTQCGTVQTTSTATNTYITLGASGTFVLNSTSNAAAGTTTLTCDFTLPTRVTATRGAVIKDIVVAVGSQTTAPTSIGTSTLGTVTYPTPSATTQTASVVTPVAAGSTVTQLGPTTTVLTVTTAGAFLTFKYTYATAVSLSTDLQTLRFTVPYVQSAAAAMTLNWPGIWVHFSAPAL